MKDNLAKQNWNDSMKCCFCHKDETIRHLFFECQLARTTWNIVQVTTNHYPPCSISNMFNSWLWGINKDFKTISVVRNSSYLLGHLMPPKWNCVWKKKCNKFFCSCYTRLSTGSVPELYYRNLSSGSWFWLHVTWWGHHSFGYKQQSSAECLRFNR
jgi:hypothetical protein